MLLAGSLLRKWGVRCAGTPKECSRGNCSTYFWGSGRRYRFQAWFPLFSAARTHASFRPKHVDILVEV